MNPIYRANRSLLFQKTEDVIFKRMMHETPLYILVVDDDALTRKLVSHTLEGLSVHGRTYVAEDRISVSDEPRDPLQLDQPVVEDFRGDSCHLIVNGRVDRHGIEYQ